jgi:phenylacetate-CoA ligase
MTWLTRESFPSGRSAEGLLLISPDGEVVAPLGPADLPAAQDLAAATLTAAGLDAGDRVVVALNNDGELTGALIAQAAVSVAQAAASVGPRGRLRLQTALEKVRATTLITTPSGAMDFLARLHLEFLLDPLDLGLKRIFLIGEVASASVYRQLASEFEASVVELFADPFLGVPIAHRKASAQVLTPVRNGLLGLAALDSDTADAPAEGLAEITVTPVWHSALGGSTLRSGQVVRLAVGDRGVPSPAHTVGEHVLIRGRWVSIPKIIAALTRIDGIGHWDLRISREGTLDVAALHVTFTRDTLVRNPMWKARIGQSLVAVTPVHITVVVEPEISETTRPAAVTDLRGQHLGRDRTQIG